VIVHSTVRKFSSHRNGFPRQIAEITRSQERRDHTRSCIHPQVISFPFECVALSTTPTASQGFSPSAQGGSALSRLHAPTHQLHCSKYTMTSEHTITQECRQASGPPLKYGSHYLNLCDIKAEPYHCWSSSGCIFSWSRMTAARAFAAMACWASAKYCKHHQAPQLSVPVLDSKVKSSFKKSPTS
jgi:hypothetical protein